MHGLHDLTDAFVSVNLMPYLCHQTEQMMFVNTLNTLRPRQNGRHFADDIFKCIFLNENVWIQIKISMKFVPMGPINNIPSLVQIMAWHGPGDKPLSEPMMVSLMMHICVTQPHWPLRYVEVILQWFLKVILQIDILNTSCEIGPRWVPQIPIADMSTLRQVMAWCHQVTSHYLSQC